MTTESPPPSQNDPSSLHPFFNPQSLYSQYSKPAVWREDGGQSAVREFLDSLGRQALRKRYLEEPDTITAADKDKWGYSDELNAELHDSLLQRSHIVGPKTVSNESDMSRSNPVIVPTCDTPRSREHAVPLRALGALEGKSSRVPVKKIDLNETPVSVDDFQKIGVLRSEIAGENELFVELRFDSKAKGRTARLLLLSPEIQGWLAKYDQMAPNDFPKFGQSMFSESLSSEVEPPTSAALTRVLRSIFNVTMREPLEVTESNIGEFRKARWVSQTLGYAVGLQRTIETTDDGSPRATFVTRFFVPLVSLPDGFQFVVVIGPKATS